MAKLIMENGNMKIEADRIEIIDDYITASDEIEDVDLELDEEKVSQLIANHLPQLLK